MSSCTSRISDVRVAWLGLVMGCGPIVATGDGDDTGGGGNDDRDDDDDDRGDDRPGTGPQPSTAPPDDDGPVDDDDGDEFDEGWTPDFWDGVACDDSSIDACYETRELDGYEGDVFAVAVGDVVGDEWPDLVVLGEFWQVIHPGEGGSWSDPIESPSTFASPSAALLGDVVSGDGLADLVVLQPPYQGVFVSVGTGEGAFYLPTYVGTPNFPLQLQIGDVDGDGVLEAVVSLEGGSIVIVRSFDPPVLEEFDAPVFDVQAFALGDIGFAAPGDDLLAAGVSIDQNLIGVNAYESASAGRWSTETFVANPLVIATRDFDGDGENDVATAAGENAFMYRRYGDGTFGDPVGVPLASTTDAAAGGAFGPSMHGLATIVDATVQVVDFQANDTQIVNGPFVRGPLVVADLNADGMDDLVAPGQDGPSVVVYTSDL
jgi:hypothetical protein